MSKRIILLQALAATATDLTYMLSSMDTAAAAKRPSTVSGSINDHLNGMITIDQQTVAHCQQILQQERPLLTPIPTVPIPTSADLHALLSNWKETRQTTITFLQNVKLGGWQRTAVTPTGTQTRFRTLVQDLVSSDTEMLNQIIAVQQAVRNQPGRNPQPAVPS